LNEVRISMTIDGVPTGSDLWLWVSGGSWFHARDKKVFIESCRDRQGKMLLLEDVDNNTFRIRPRSESMEINYTALVREVWRNPGEGYTSYVCQDFAIIPEHTVFLRPNIQAERIRLKIVAPSNWTILTIHRKESPNSLAAEPGMMWDTYLALGEFRTKTVKALLGKVEVTVASLGETIRPIEEYAQHLPKLLDIYCVTVGKYPFDKLIVILAPRIMAPGQLLSGATCQSEHDWNTIAHELFHQWNRRVMIPEDEDSVAWFAEGFTDYYTLMGLCKTGIWDFRKFAKYLRQNIRQYESWQGTNYDLPVVKAWTVQREKTDSSYQAIPYVKGCLIAALLDYDIRQNRKEQNLDLFMKQLCGKYYFRKISNSVIEQVLRDFTGRDYKLFFENYVYGTAGLPLERVLADEDKDGLISLVESIIGTSPNERDSDGDGLTDGGEVFAETDPLDPDTDGTGTPDLRKVNIVVDGYADDWQRLRVGPVIRDRVGDVQIKDVGGDIESVALAIDADRLFVMVTFADGLRMPDKTKYYCCLLLDLNLDGNHDFEVGYNIGLGYSWLWDLTKPGGYSNRSNVKTIEDCEVILINTLELCFPLHHLGSFDKFKLAFVVGVIDGDRYITVDFAGYSDIKRTSETLPSNSVNRGTPKMIAKAAISQAQQVINLSLSLGMEKEATEAQRKLNDAIAAFNMADYQRAYAIAESAAKQLVQDFRVEIQKTSQVSLTQITQSTSVVEQQTTNYLYLAIPVMFVIVITLLLGRRIRKGMNGKTQ